MAIIDFCDLAGEIQHIAMPDHRTILISGAERFWQVRHPDAHRAGSPMARVWPASGDTEDRPTGKPENILRVSTAPLSKGKTVLLSRFTPSRHVRGSDTSCHL